MGTYSEYLDKHLNFEQLTAERKKYLKQVSSLRDGNDVFTYAADLTLPDPKISIIYEDIIAIKDQLENLSGNALDVILETPGGIGEIAEDIVNLFRSKYSRVSFIIPGSAKSAGTIITMSGDEILMEPASSLGPIDAQLQWRDKAISADAFLEGFKRIKDEVQTSGNLNKAYIPILSNISPGEIEHAQNALKFAHTLVSDWLTQYKFKNWKIHSSTNQPVTPDERKKRALDIAEALSDQKRWKTHGRSIKIRDLEGLKLKITDYSHNRPLYEAISRYYTVLRMCLDSTNIYKIFETPVSQIYRFKIPPGGRPVRPPQQTADAAIIPFECPKCNATTNIQASFKSGVALEQGAIPFPADDQFKCPNCGSIINLKDLRLQIESEAKRRILS